VSVGWVNVYMCEWVDEFCRARLSARSARLPKRSGGQGLP